jgi:hypothetical protein
MRRLLLASVIAVLTATGLGTAVSPSPAAASAPRHGLPADGPPALYRPPPQLAKAHGWPAANNAFPATSGTGRLADGAMYWTDFLYDDHGATAPSTGGVSVTAGSPSFGTYTYPAGPAHGNGADIFRAGVALRRHATYWRVDWNTLAKPTVPIAEWTFDRDHRASTGASEWPADAGVSSPGIDTALVVSAHGAELVNAATGAVERRLPTVVTRRARAFVVRVPRRVLPVNGTWRIRLAAGLANAAGTGFRRPPDAGSGQPSVYNVTFRRRTQEPTSDDFWDDMAQTRALGASTVTPFSLLLRWRQLARRVRTRQARPSGWSDRWYASSVSLGQGVLTGPSTISDGRPNYLGRVQPYAVYVPKGGNSDRPMPLTFLLHSLTQNQNQYAATTPKFTQEACQRRHSLCVTTLGRGPDGNYFDTAELDFWQVWHAVAKAYDIDPNHTVLCGYSMGGIGTNQLAMEHPDLFARAITLAGAVGNVPSLVNLRWVPTYLAGGAADELVPVTVERAEARALQALGYRFRWLLVPGIDHVGYELADAFSDAAHYMGRARRRTNPASFSFRWQPRNGAQSFGQRGADGGGISWTQRPGLGVGTTGDYWLRDLKARARRHDAWLHAVSGERPRRATKPVLTHSVDGQLDPEPGAVTTQRWVLGARAQRRPVIRLRLHNVAALRVLPTAAGFGSGRRGRLLISSDGPCRIRIGSHQLRVRAGKQTVSFQG